MNKEAKSAGELETSILEALREKHALDDVVGIEIVPLSPDSVCSWEARLKMAPGKGASPHQGVAFAEAYNEVRKGFDLGR